MRIPDYLTGTIAAFDFFKNNYDSLKPAVQSLIRDFLFDNRTNTFLFRFVGVNDEVKAQRVIIAAR